MIPNELTLEERRAAIMNLIVIMLADGEIKREEMQVLRAVADRVGVTKVEIEDMIKNPHKVRFVVPRSIKQRVLQLLDMILMMSVDGDIDQREKDLCTKFALAMGFSPLKVSQLIEAAAKGIQKGKSRNEIGDEISLEIDV